MPTYYQIKTRRGTLAQWNSSNPTLGDGEVAYVSDNGRFKVGDGSRRFSQLPYVTLPDATANAAGLLTSAQFVKLSNLTKTTQQTDNLIYASAGSVIGNAVRLIAADSGLQLVYSGDTNFIQAMAVNGSLITPSQEVDINEGDFVDFLFIDEDKLNVTIPKNAFKGVQCKKMVWPDYITYVMDGALDNFKCEELQVFGLTPPAFADTPNSPDITKTKIHKVVQAFYQATTWDSITTLDLI